MKCLDMRIRVFLHYRIVYEFSTIKKNSTAEDTHFCLCISYRDKSFRFCGTTLIDESIHPLLTCTYIHGSLITGEQSRRTLLRYHILSSRPHKSIHLRLCCLLPPHEDSLETDLRKLLFLIYGFNRFVFL